MVAQSIPLPPPACLLPIVHPGIAIGKRHTPASLHDVRTMLHDLVLILLGPMQAPTVVDRGQHGH